VYIGDRVPCLGTIRTAAGLEPHARTMETLATVTDVDSAEEARRVVGLLRYLVPSVPQLAVPLHELNGLTSTARAFKKGPAVQRTLEYVKDALLGAVVRAAPDTTMRLESFVDSSDIGCGGIWFQTRDGEIGILRAWSKSYGAEMMHKSAVDKELYGLYQNLIQGEPYITLWNDEPFLVYTDHKPLLRIVEERDASKLRSMNRVRIERRLYFIGQFEQMRLVYIPGETNMADVLTRPPFVSAPSSAALGLPAREASATTRKRAPRQETVNVVTEAVVPPKEKADMEAVEPLVTLPMLGGEGTDPLRLALDMAEHTSLTEYPIDVFEKCMTSVLLEAGIPEPYASDPLFEETIGDVTRFASDMKMQGGRLYYTGSNPGYYVRAEQREGVLLEAHASARGGHYAVAGTLAKLSGVAWWPHIEAEVEKLCGLCGSCQRTPPAARHTLIARRRRSLQKGWARSVGSV
jgi:hypothetical protein